MAKLTATEKKWLNQLQEHLNKAPASLIRKGSANTVRSFTIGDQDVTVYDGDAVDKHTEGRSNNHIADVCVDVQNSDAELFNLKFPFCVESTSG